MKTKASHLARAASKSASRHERLAATLREGIERHEDLWQRCARKASGPDLHQLRTESRRLLASVAVASAICRERTQKIQRALERCLHRTARLRDAEVQLRIVEKLVPKYPELAALRRHLRRIVRRRSRSVAEKFRGRKKKLGKRVRALAVILKTREETGATRGATSRVFREAVADAEALGRAAHRDAAQLHVARLALKRLRYLAEALRGVVPGITAAWLAQLRRRQHAMGEIHDLQLFSRRLARERQKGRRLHRVEVIIATREQRLMQAWRSQSPVGSRPGLRAH